MKLQPGFLSSIVDRVGKVFLGSSLGVLWATGGVQAQKEANNWIFGSHAGINFSSSVPAPFSGASILTNEGSAVISDQSGTLLFYTDGQTVWNKNHQPMPNGAGLLGGSSATQSAIIVPWPQSDCSKYFVFTVDAVEDNLPDSLRYSVVDLSLPSGSGLGDLVSKNTLLKTLVSEKLTAVSDSSGTGFWVIAHGFENKPGSSANKEYYSYHITASGINITPVISTVGSAHEGATATPLYASQGQMKVSPDGKLIASAVRSGFIDILNFSTLTGIVSGPAKKFDKDNSAFKTNLFYGVEFSPNSKLLYVSTTEGSPNEVLQLDLTTSNGTTLYTKQKPAGTGVFYDTGELQMGPDKKVYVARYGQSFISVIDSPDTVGPGASFNPSGPALSTTAQSRLGLPTIIAGNFS